jgi:HAD superfamily hydrolase (TIGR01662 family)
MNEVVMLMGIQASGKTGTSQEFINKGYVHLNRDQIGGTLEKLVPMLSAELSRGNNVILDNTFGTKKSRKPFIEVCQQNKVLIRCLHMDTSIEDAQFNAAKRMITRYGKLLSLEEIKSSKDPNIFPVAVLFNYQKNFEEPTLDEGFSSVEKIKFVRQKDPNYCNKALILDYDGTLRKTKSGQDYPTESNDIEALPNRNIILQQYKDDGYLLLGISNQSGIGKGKLSHGAAKACFDKTNELIGHEIDYVYCPHGSFPIACYCRKPLPGYGVYFIEKYKLDASQCIFVGDMTSDKTFAQRSGFQFIHADKFFK